MGLSISTLVQLLACAAPLQAAFIHQIRQHTVTVQAVDEATDGTLILPDGTLILPRHKTAQPIRATHEAIDDSLVLAPKPPPANQPVRQLALGDLLSPSGSLTTTPSVSAWWKRVLQPRTTTIKPVTQISDGQPQAPGPTPVDVITIGTLTITANPTGFVVGSATVTPGGPAITVGSTKVTLDTSGVVVYGTATATLTNPDVFTVGSVIVTANPTGFVAGGKTLSPGGSPIVVGSETVSLGSSGVIVIGGSTKTLPASETITGGGTGGGTVGGTGHGTVGGTGSTSWLSSDTSAFAGSNSVTAFTINGVTQSYTRLTYSDFESFSGTTTIQTTVKTTDSSGKTSTKTEGVIVGPTGVHWGCLGLCGIVGGGGGGGGFCIWPFSCPPGGGDDGEGGSGGGGGGGNPTNGPTNPTAKTNSPSGTTKTSSSSSSSTSEYCAASVPACLDNSDPYPKGGNAGPPTKKLIKRNSDRILENKAAHGGKLRRYVLNGLRLVATAGHLVRKYLSPHLGVLVERALPVPGSDIGIYVLTALHVAFGLGNLVPLLPPNPPGGIGVSSSKTTPLLKVGLDAGVQGLYGCTSVIIVSTEAVYVTHFWEVPAFLVAASNPFTGGQPTDQDTFNTEVIDKLRTGSGTDIAGLVGLTGSTQPFAPDTAPEIVIMTPQAINSPNGANKYPTQIGWLILALNDLFPGVSPIVKNYVKRGDYVSQKYTPAGKALVEYSPDQSRQCGGQQCKARVWIEDLAEPVLEKTWEAGVNQLIVPPGRKVRRAVDAVCTLTGSESGTVTVPSATNNPLTSPLSDCTLITTSLSGLSPYCTCGSGIIAGINTVTAASSLYQVCAGSPDPTVGTLSRTTATAKSVTVAPVTVVSPSIPTSTAPMENAIDQVCAGILNAGTRKPISDIFDCGSSIQKGTNETLFHLFAPAGTPHSTDPSKNKNDEGGWGTWQGGGCFCINGNFCCAEDAVIPADWTEDEDALDGGYEVLNTKQGQLAVDSYKSAAGSPAYLCHCNG